MLGITIVHKILEEIDEDEFKCYFPKNFVTVFNKDSNELIYTHKFDPNIKTLLERCQLEKDLYVIVYSCNEYGYIEGLTLEKDLQQRLGL